MGSTCSCPRWKEVSDVNDSRAVKRTLATIASIGDQTLAVPIPSQYCLHLECDLSLSLVLRRCGRRFGVVHAPRRPSANSTRSRWSKLLTRSRCKSVVLVTRHSQWESPSPCMHSGAIPPLFRSSMLIKGCSTSGDGSRSHMGRRESPGSRATSHDVGRNKNMRRPPGGFRLRGHGRACPKRYRR